MNIKYETECFWILTILDSFGMVSSVSYGTRFEAMKKYVEWERSSFGKHSDTIICLDRIHPLNLKAS